MAPSRHWTRSNRRVSPRRLRSIRRQLLIAALLIVPPGCAKRPPASVPLPAASLALRAAALPVLQSELDELFQDAALERAAWAVLVQSLDTGEVLYSHQARKLMMPASNMKILTLAAAADRLGWDYRFETSVLAAGAIDEAGMLHGDLVVRGSGDPSIGDRSGHATDVFGSWADELTRAGIRRIDGCIIGDDNAFDDEALGAGWAWDYLAYGYAAPIGALPFNEDAVDLVIRAGRAAGDPVQIEIRPAENGLALYNRLITGTKDSATAYDLRRIPGDSRLEITGTIPAGTEEFTQSASVGNPTEFFTRTLRAVLISRGIPVSGPAIDIDVAPVVPDLTQARVLVSHRSQPLSELAGRLMKISQNLYAEILLKAMGRRAGVGTAENGRAVVREVLDGWGIGVEDVVMYDGSGLSRYNYVTADALVKVLTRMYEDPRHRKPFLAALPVAARDGSLANRLEGTKAEGVLRGKTGSIANVRSLSGYLRAADGETLVFSMLANHFTAPQATIDAVMDRAVERLAEFKRR